LVKEINFLSGPSPKSMSAAAKGRLIIVAIPVNTKLVVIVFIFLPFVDNLMSLSVLILN
jgi:hypothetical protein